MHVGALDVVRERWEDLVSCFSARKFSIIAGDPGHETGDMEDRVDTAGEHVRGKLDPIRDRAHNGSDFERTKVTGTEFGGGMLSKGDELRVKTYEVSNLEGKVSTVAISLDGLVGFGQLQFLCDDCLDVFDMNQIVSCRRVRKGAVNKADRGSGIEAKV